MLLWTLCGLQQMMLKFGVLFLGVCAPLPAAFPSLYDIRLPLSLYCVRRGRGYICHSCECCCLKSVIMAPEYSCDFCPIDRLTDAVLFSFGFSFLLTLDIIQMGGFLEPFLVSDVITDILNLVLERRLLIYQIAFCDKLSNTGPYLPIACSVCSI
ncbi:hypothetical protein STEG23_033588, partial [Scotinomys teguina]